MAYKTVRVYSNLTDAAHVTVNGNTPRWESDGYWSATINTSVNRTITLVFDNGYTPTLGECGVKNPNGWLRYVTFSADASAYNTYSCNMGSNFDYESGWAEIHVTLESSTSEPTFQCKMTASQFNKFSGVSINGTSQSGAFDVQVGEGDVISITAGSNVTGIEWGIENEDTFEQEYLVFSQLNGVWTHIITASEASTYEGWTSWNWSVTTSHQFTFTKGSPNPDRWTCTPTAGAAYDLPYNILVTPVSGYRITSGYLEYDNGWGDSVSGVLNNGVLTISLPDQSDYTSGVVMVFTEEDVSPTYTGKIEIDSRVDFSRLTVSPTEEFSFSDDVGQIVRLTPDDGYRLTEAKMFYGTLNEDNFTIQSDGSWTYTLTGDDKDSGTLVEGVYQFTIYYEGEAIPAPSTERMNFYTIYEPTNSNMETINDAIFIDSQGTVNVLNNFISYKRFFCTIPSDGTTALKAGRYNFNVLAPYVDEPTLEIDCGSIDITELRHSLVDYSPYTQIRVYLPFCGFEYLDVEKLMGHRVHLKYQVDILSGRCLAQLYVDLVSPETCYYQFGGTIAAEEPFSQGGNYKGWYELITTNMLGELQPYVVVSTAKLLEGNLAEYEGLPTAQVVRVGDVDGYVEYKSIHAEGMLATESEKLEIERLLREGVYVDPTV